MLLAAFRLAFHFRRPPSELRISFREFLHCLKYLQIEPPDEAENNRTAVLLAQISNMAGKSLPKGKHMKPEDFIGRKRAQTAEEQKAFLKSITGGRDG